MFEMKKEFETVEKNDFAYSATETDNGFDNLIASYNDLENLIKFESALIKEDNPEIIKYIIKENNAEYLLDEEVTLETYMKDNWLPLSKALSEIELSKKMQDINYNEFWESSKEFKDKFLDFKFSYPDLFPTQIYKKTLDFF